MSNPEIERLREMGELLAERDKLLAANAALREEVKALRCLKEEACSGVPRRAVILGHKEHCDKMRLATDACGAMGSGTT